VTDVSQRDLVKVQGTVLVVTAVVILVGFVVDVAHRLIDPRLRVTR
jgi:peptide/nickel transport system permease protein